MSGILAHLSKNKNATRVLDAKGSMKNRLKNEYASGSIASLGTSGLDQAVKLPKGESKNEWLAVHVVDYINSVGILYGSLEEYCTMSNCPKMNAGTFEYLWMDKKEKKFKHPTQVAAPEYVELLMQWVEGQVNDESIFPSDASTPFPSDFVKRCKKIFSRLFRVYAHIYLEHFEDVRKLAEDAHLNTNFKHFLYFSFEFDLVDPKEMIPVREIIVKLLGDDYRAKIPEK